MQVTEYTDRWINSLRNDGLQQGTNYLKREAKGKISYCCLGVAGELIGAFCVRWHGYPNHHWLTPGGSHGYLDDDQAEKLGLARAEQLALGSLNDSYNWTFAQVADLIEAAKTKPNAIIEAEQQAGEDAR